MKKIIELKKQYPNADVLAHPECKKSILALATKVGSTAALLKHAMNSDKKEFIKAKYNPTNEEIISNIITCIVKFFLIITAI